MMLRFLSFRRKPVAPTSSPLFLYNTLTKELQRFELPAGVKAVRMYNCGPTVYDTSHIGNLRSYLFADLVYRALTYNGFTVKQVINITDFGHLSSDADAGPDKMTKALKKEGLALTLENMRALAEKYTEQFMRDLQLLGVDTSHIEFPRASDHIRGEIALIHTLEEKGYTYRGKDGVYYDTSRFPEYGKLGEIDLKGLMAGARIAQSEDKRHSTDFLLWKSDRHLGWDSPWGKGFPGWHIECSAMINATLGKQIDIHTGGIDLLPTHHNNEIAQSEAATGKKPLARFWMHHEFLNIKAEKISKSLGNMINLDELTKRGFHPLAYRYYLLGGHYRSAMNFTWDALEASQTAFLRLRALVQSAPEGGLPHDKHLAAILERIDDDLDSPGALSRIWELTKDSSVSPADMRATIADVDKILGLKLAEDDELAVSLSAAQFGRVVDTLDLPEDILLMVDEREQARTDKNWRRADELRSALLEKGYTVDDRPEGPQVRTR